MLSILLPSFCFPSRVCFYFWPPFGFFGGGALGAFDFLGGTTCRVFSFAPPAAPATRPTPAPPNDSARLGKRSRKKKKRRFRLVNSVESKSKKKLFFLNILRTNRIAELRNETERQPTRNIQLTRSTLTRWSAGGTGEGGAALGRCVAECGPKFYGRYRARLQRHGLASATGSVFRSSDWPFEYDDVTMNQRTRASRGTSGFERPGRREERPGERRAAGWIVVVGEPPPSDSWRRPSGAQVLRCGDCCRRRRRRRRRRACVCVCVVRAAVRPSPGHVPMLL